MHTPQRPIGSGFGYRSTAAEVIDGIDLSGKLAILTGGYSGLGLETVKALVGAGAHVVVPARRRATAEQALDGISGIEIDELDLGDQASVRAFSERFLASGRPLDLLINNAGIMALPETRVGPGWEAQFATNHLGHYTLTNLLWPRLAEAASARVVALSSRGHKRSGIRFADLMFERGYDKWEAYGQSKSANSLFAVELDTLGEDAGVHAFAVHPGPIMTPLQRHLGPEFLREAGWVDEEGNPSERFKTPSRARPRRPGPRRAPASTAWAGSTARTATSPRRPCRARPPPRSPASTRTRSTPRSRGACGPCPRS
jgi:NAD(P)-dependent dehydrogenase (short-subunit alcohol dehydrogenase family)